MKKLLIIPILIFFLASSCFAQEPIQLARMSAMIVGAGGEAACVQETTDSQTSGVTLFGAARTNRNYNFTSFTADGTGTYTVKRVELEMKKVGTPTSCSAGKVALCNYDGANSRCGTTCQDVGTFDIAALPTVLAFVGFNYSAGYALTNGTKYCIRTYCSSVEASGTDINIRGYDAEVGQNLGYGTDGINYITTGSAQYNFKVKLCTE